MEVPGLGRVRKPIVYCFGVFVFIVLYFIIVYPNLPVPSADYRIDENDKSRALVVVKDFAVNVQLVCPNGGTKKNLRCSAINDDKVNYDRAIGQDFLGFVESLKKKTKSIV